MTTTQKDILDFLKSVYGDDKSLWPTAKKYKNVFARYAREGEQIITITSDGKETVNYATFGDKIVMNDTEAKEQYIIKSEKFDKLYELSSQDIVNFTEENSPFSWFKYKPKGRIYAFEIIPFFKNEKSFETSGSFVASWGQEMIYQEGDFFCIPISDQEEVYRIARKEFYETYRFENPEQMAEQRYFLDTDVDGHWYIVPENKKSEWVAWCCLLEDDPKAWDAPDFATRVGGSPTLVTFTHPKIR